MKIHRFLLFFSICLIVSCNKSKANFSEYDKYIWNAMLEYKKDNNQEALENFQRAFEIIPDENVSDYFYAIASALKLKKDTIAKDLLIESIINTNASENYFDNFKEFDSFRDHPVLKNIKENYQHYQSLFFKNLDHPHVYREIDSMIDVDQKVRDMEGADRETVQKVDSTNILRLMDITKEHGWQRRGWLILWHQRGSYEEQNYVWGFFQTLH